MSEAGTKVVPIPGGEKLLSNTLDTGRLLVDDYEAVLEFEERLSKEQLIEIIRGHGQIGQAMVDAAVRTRRAM